MSGSASDMSQNNFTGNDTSFEQHENALQDSQVPHVNHSAESLNQNSDGYSQDSSPRTMTHQQVRSEIEH